MSQTNYELMLRYGREEAAKETTFLGELRAWEKVVAQFISIEENWRPPAWFASFVRMAERKRAARLRQ